MEIHVIGGGLCRSRQPILTLGTGSNWMPRFQLMMPILGVMFFFACQRPLDAQLTILHSFGDGSVTNDGANPQAGLIQAPNGDFFGVTTHQAAQPDVAAGTVFRMTPAGRVSVIYRFGFKSNLWSDSPLLYYHGKLIGVTPSGPSSTGTGSLFALSKSASTSKWRLSFWQKNIGVEGNVILGSDGNFYGVGFDGVFKISPTTHQVTTVFNTIDSSNYFVAPGLVEGSDGNFYGSTLYLRGLQYQSGAIFQLAPSGQVSFTQFQVLAGTGPMIQAGNGTFYGIGGTFDDIGTMSPGIVFSYPPNGSPSILHLFGQGSDGTYPVGTVVQGPKGDLYGVTSLGGTAGAGILFEVSTLGVYTILHNFGDGSIQNDGLGPQGTLIVGKDNNLYGTTSGGGKAGLGIVFKFTL
ncbi:MAG: hypothetical protein JOZ31_10725 [Verrucomicrobia bacterium]|nr:hypothetical protein [Verrucomicrobiota bacterium]MBV8483800.1 hypothetical protein [Verrucomicrobiota bacterium]